MFATNCLKIKIIIHQLVKLTDANMSFTAGNLFPLIHAFGDWSQVPTGIRTWVPRLRGRRLTLPLVCLVGVTLSVMVISVYLCYIDTTITGE